MASVKAEKAARILSLHCNVVSRALLREALTNVGHGLTPAQYCGLRFVALHPGACIRDMARGLQVSHPAAMKLAERLQKRGLITRTQSMDDQRRVSLHTTRRGERLWRRIRDYHAGLIAKALDRMGAGKAEQLLRLLVEFMQKILESEEQVAKVCLYCGIEHDNGCPVGKIEEKLTGRPRTEY